MTIRPSCPFCVGECRPPAPVALLIVVKPSFEELDVVGEVSAANLRSLARSVVNAMVLIDKDDEGPAVRRLGAAEPTEAEIERLIETMEQAGLIAPGHLVVEIPWRVGERRIVSLGVVDAEGAPVFEPVLHFMTQTVALEIPGPRRGSWVEGPLRRVLRNGFGRACVEVEWEVKAVDSECRLVDPAPHLPIRHERTNCWLWQQATTHGERTWCKPHAACGADRGCSTAEGAGEQCVRWKLVTYVARGLSSVGSRDRERIEDGIALQRTLSVYKRPFGSHSKYSTLRDLCAASGPLSARP